MSNDAAEVVFGFLMAVVNGGEITGDASLMSEVFDEALAAERSAGEREARRATVERIVALLDTMIAHPRNEPRYRAAFAGLKVARRAILDEEAAR